MTALDVAGSREEFALFNPAFTAAILAEATRGHREQTGAFGALPIIFSAATIAMFAHTRTQLPSTTRTHLSRFLQEQPGFRPEFHRLMRGSATPLWAGLTFATNQQTLRLDVLEVVAVGPRKPRPPELSDETELVLSAARWCGRWLGRSGTSATVLSVLGFEP